MLSLEVKKSSVKTDFSFLVHHRMHVHDRRMNSRNENRLTYFARTNFRDRCRPFGIKQADRLSHIYAVGKTGTGKSTLLETLIRQDIDRGEGVALVDPHGDLVERIAKSIPAHRKQDVIYFDVPGNTEYGYNPLRWVRPDKRSLAASGLLEVFHKMWGEKAWGQRMEHILRNAVLALLEVPGATLPDLLRMLRDDSFRRRIAGTLSNAQVKEFWLYEYPKYSYRYRADAIAPVQSKVGAFLADPRLYRILTEREKTLRIRSIMDEGKILLVNLAKGKLGEDSSSLLGGLLVTTIGLAGFSRADLAEEKRRPFYVYIDEFQTFTTLALANMLSELRKHGVGLVLAHQYLDQLETEIRNAVLGNAGTLIVFRVGAKDAGFLAREFMPALERVDLLTLPNYHIYLKLMVDGEPVAPFSAITLMPHDA